METAPLSDDGLIVNRVAESAIETLDLAALAPPEPVAFDLARGRPLPEEPEEVLVFTDANSMYAPGALKRLLAPLADDKIGCVCGELQYADSEEGGVGKGEGAYWSYEQFLKQRESLLSSALGANGAIYALRRELFEELGNDIISDFIMPIRVWRRGYRVVYEPKAIANRCC